MIYFDADISFMALISFYSCNFSVIAEVGNENITDSFPLLADYEIRIVIWIQTLWK